MMGQRKETRGRVERRLNNLKQEVIDIDAWLDKKREQVEKHLKIVQAKGYVIDYDFDEITKETYDKYNSYLFAEAYRAQDDGTTKTVINSIWTLHNSFSDIADKRDRKQRVNEKWIPELEEKLEAFGPRPQSEIDDEKRRKEELELIKFVRQEYKNWYCEDLENWLEEYRNDLIEWINNSDNLTDWQKKSELNRVDGYVNEQKFDLLARTYKYVGKIESIQLARLGDNGTFNGKVTGEKGTRKVETIIAGGHNIQRMHYRVLVK